jgi:hypothetical protein
MDQQTRDKYLMAIGALNAARWAIPQVEKHIDCTVPMFSGEREELWREALRHFDDAIGHLDMAESYMRKLMEYEVP